MPDIVYILRNDIDQSPEELRYSIRSVVQNFPFDNLWIIGGCPKGIHPDYYLPVTQKGPNKWTKVRNCLEMICNQPLVSENFWLFNDDFFVMKPVTEVPCAVSGTMYKRIQKIMWGNNLSQYAKQLFITKKALENKGFDTLDYALHIPMLVNKEKALATLKLFSQIPMFRCCYGNQHDLVEIVMKDVKIKKLHVRPTGEETFLSTTEKSFNEGEVGRYIRAQFPEACRYEE